MQLDLAYNCSCIQLMQLHNNSVTSAGLLST